MKPIKLFAVWILTSLAFLSAADDVDCQQWNIEITEDYRFPLSNTEAKIAYSKLCNILVNNAVVDPESLRGDFIRFHSVLHTEAQAVLGEMYPQVRFLNQPHFDPYDINRTARTPGYNSAVPNGTLMEFSLMLGNDDSGSDPGIPQVDLETARACYNQVEQCWNPLVQFMQLLAETYGAFGIGEANEAHGILAKRDQLWMDYIDNARSQTWLDVIASSVVYSWTIDDAVRQSEFIPPPKVQYFFLKPNLIIDNLGAALDGDEIKEALALEIIGFNYWQDTCFGMACGASLIATYADREGVEDNGWGIMAHLDNRFSFGVTKYGSDTGFFVTVDLLKFIQDKQQNFNDYKTQVRDKLKL